MTEHGFWPGSFLAALARGTHCALPLPFAQHRAGTLPSGTGGSLRTGTPRPSTATAGPTLPEARLETGGSR